MLLNSPLPSIASFIRVCMIATPEMQSVSPVTSYHNQYREREGPSYSP